MSTLEGQGSPERIKESKYDVIVVLGAVMKWNEEAKIWDFPTTVEKELYSGHLVMGKARAIAASDIQEDGAKLLITGGVQKHPETGELASRAQELTRLITEKYHVPPEKVVPIGTVGAAHTQGNVENVVAYLQSHADELKKNRIAILSPRFQKKRAEMMFDANPYFKDHNIAIDWIVVEDVLEKRHPLYKRWAEKVKKTPEAAVAEKMEAQGREALKGGTYKPARDKNESS